MAKGFRRGKSQKGSKQSDVGEWMEDDADDRGATALPGEGECVVTIDCQGRLFCEEAAWKRLA